MKPQKASVADMHVAAPVGGINSISVGGQMPPEDCISLYNMVAAEQGLRTRLGYREWCTGLDGEVRSILPFTGSDFSGSKDKLFACTPSGIWDVTSSSASPTRVIGFLSTANSAGYGISCVVVGAAGHFLLYCDEENGYYTYTESTGVWVKIAMGAGATDINGVDPATFCHVMVWKSRVWFTQKNTGLAWYTASPGITGSPALYGTVTSFNFAGQFRSGGSLIGMFNWTIDGGVGVDDHLVGLSTGGDVVVYVGTDPSSASTFGLKGKWYVGGFPAGRRIATDFGGELLLLTNVGVLQLSKILGGAAEEDKSQYATVKISNLFNLLASNYRTQTGWSLRLHPADNTLLITLPVIDGEFGQLTMSLWNKSWSRYRALPILSSEVFGGQLYFGTKDARVCINTGYVDNVLLTDSSSYTQVDYSLIGSYQNLGSGKQKQITNIRPIILSLAQSPPYQVQAKYNFDLAELAAVTSTATTSGNVWDTALWDAALWGGDFAPSLAVHGAAGMGAHVAIAIRGKASDRTVLVGYDVQFRQGGFL